MKKILILLLMAVLLVPTSVDAQKKKRATILKQELYKISQRGKTWKIEENPKHFMLRKGNIEFTLESPKHSGKISSHSFTFKIWIYLNWQVD